MKKIKIIIFILLFMICLNVKAEGTCSTDELNRLKELANNVEIIKELQVDDSRYDVEKKNGLISAYYKIKITNLNDELLIFYNNRGVKQTIDVGTIDNLVFIDGTTTTFYIYAYTNNSCVNEPLRTITVKFDKYNLYYYINKDKCEQYSEFEYCKEYMNIGNKKYEEIDKLFDKYIEENKVMVTTNSNLYYIAGGIILICLVTILIVVIIRKYKKNQL